MRLRSLGLVALCTAALVACAPTAAPSQAPAPTPAAPAPTSATAAANAALADGEVTVFAASSLTDAFTELGDRFQAANPGSTVRFNFGASTQLRTQLEQGARADVFASANQAEMDKARAAGVIGGSDRVVARNRLTLIFPKANPARIAALKDLARPGLKLVTAAPEVPIGLYTQAMLDKMVTAPAYGADFKDRVNANVVSREPNVRQVVAKVSLGEADAAVVYTTDLTPDLATSLGTLAIPDRFNTLVSYPVAIVQDAPRAAAAEAFVSYLLAPDGQAILNKWGFLPGG